MKTEQKLNFYFHQYWQMSLILETVFKAVHSTVTKIIQLDQQIPAFPKLSLNAPTRQNY